MPNSGTAKIVTINRHRIKSKCHEKIAALAYEFWLARGFRDGSPEEDLIRALCALPDIQIIDRPPSTTIPG